VLPFGLSTACTLSTKLARLAYKKIWRSEGKQVIMLLDFTSQINCLQNINCQSCFTIDNVPNQINRLVAFHSDFSTLGTKPLLIKSHFT
jgi:hypothetical protein